VTLTGTHQTIGTMAYLAPEQLEGRPITPAADVYALGLVLLECLTGGRAFVGPPAEAAAARLHHDPEVDGTLPAPWPDLLRAMTARDPDRRPSAPEVRDRLGTPAPTTSEATAVMPAAVVDAAVRTVPVDVVDGRELPSRRSRRPLVLALVSLMFVVAVAAGVWAATRDGSTIAPAVATSTTVPPSSATPSTTVVVATTTLPPPTGPTPPVDGGGKAKGAGKGKAEPKGPARGPGPAGHSGKKGDD